MTAPKLIEPQDRLLLLQDLTTLQSDADDAVQKDPKWFLLLDAHKRALRIETMIVRGGRGAGKSALFDFLQHVASNPSLIDTAGIQLPASTWVEGFTNSPSHPALESMGSFGQQANELERRSFWLAWLCSRLAETSSESKNSFLKISSGFGVKDPKTLATLGAAHVQELSDWLDSLNESRVNTTPFVVTYDRLDRMGSDPSEMIVSLLQLWLNLSDRYRFIRAKIFIREDLFQKSLFAFPDASKLDARSISIDWQVQDLYRVLIKHMANTSERLREWIESSINKVPLKNEGLMGWTPPSPLQVSGRPSQKSFVDHLAGEKMGAAAKKGFTYTWIPNRLQDAHSRVVPRSMLALIRNAAQEAINRGPTARYLRLLEPEELQFALNKTSIRRVAEVREEFEAIARLANLKGENVLLQRSVAVKKLRGPIRGGDKDRFGEDGEAVLMAAIEQGVMSARSDGRIDVPDIYREAFGILRKGGVKRPT